MDYVVFANSVLHDGDNFPSRRGMEQIKDNSKFLEEELKIKKVTIISFPYDATLATAMALGDHFQVSIIENDLFRSRPQEQRKEWMKEMEDFILKIGTDKDDAVIIVGEGQELFYLSYWVCKQRTIANHIHPKLHPGGMLIINLKGGPFKLRESLV